MRSIYHHCHTDIHNLDPFADHDIYMIARAVQGEGAHLFKDRRDQAGIAIAHVVRNQVLSPYFPDEVAQVVREHFHGIAHVGDPDAWATALAWQSLSLDDTTCGSVFVLSCQDLHSLGLYHCVRYAQRSFVRGIWELHFFTDWPTTYVKEDIS